MHGRYSISRTRFPISTTTTVLRDDDKEDTCLPVRAAVALAVFEDEPIESGQRVASESFALGIHLRDRKEIDAVLVAVICSGKSKGSKTCHTRQQ